MEDSQISNPNAYLLSIRKLSGYIDKVLSDSRTTLKEYTFLLQHMSEVESAIPAVAGDRSAVRMLSGRRLLIQEKLIAKPR